MVVFPLIAFGISAACAAVIGYDAWRRPKPDRVVWTIAFVIFAVAAGVEVLGSLTEWSATLARIYYLCGAVLVVGYLALGEGYLLARSRIEKYAPGVTILVTAIAITLVIDAPVDASRLADDGWDALERGTALTALTMALTIRSTETNKGNASQAITKVSKSVTPARPAVGLPTEADSPSFRAGGIAAMISTALNRLAAPAPISAAVTR